MCLNSKQEVQRLLHDWTDKPTVALQSNWKKNDKLLRSLVQYEKFMLLYIVRTYSSSYHSIQHTYRTLYLKTFVYRTFEQNQQAAFDSVWLHILDDVSFFITIIRAKEKMVSTVYTPALGLYISNKIGKNALNIALTDFSFLHFIYREYNVSKLSV